MTRSIHSRSLPFTLKLLGGKLLGKLLESFWGADGAAVIMKTPQTQKQRNGKLENATWRIGKYKLVFCLPEN